MAGTRIQLEVNVAAKIAPDGHVLFCKTQQHKQGSYQKLRRSSGILPDTAAAKARKHRVATVQMQLNLTVLWCSGQNW